MIRLQAKLFQDLQDPANLLASLQTALELEHATIPPYLVAAYSLMNENGHIAELILDVAFEEMLHMILVCNLINALGGAPRLNSPDFVPTYPTFLPGAVQGELLVPLAPFNKKLLEEVFMKIEEPEDPQKFPVIALAGEAPALTIGAFYRRVKTIIEDGGDALFTGDPQRQIVRRIDDNRSTAVTNVQTAIAAIDLIVEQGEGTASSPLEALTGEPAHYYRFEGILHGRALRADSSVPEGYSFSGDPIPFDQTKVYPVKSNLRVADLDAGSEVRAVAEEFNRQYTRMLGDLHRGFNGEPARIGAAVNIMMGDLPNLARQLVQTEIAPGVNAGPTFEFAPLD